jgi:CheY-like chemotaxis protein
VAAFAELASAPATAKRNVWTLLAKALQRALALLRHASAPSRTLPAARAWDAAPPPSAAGWALSANDPFVCTNDAASKPACFQRGEQPHTQVEPRLDRNLPPMSAAAIDSAQPRPRVRQAGHLPPAGLHILVVDDIPLNRTLLERWLSAAGMQVVSVADGAAAVSLVCQSRFDLILMDVSMPKINGLEATKMIRALGQGTPRQAYFENLPIIGVSAHAMTGDREAFMASGMDDYITKPIHRVTLFAKIDGLVQQPSGPC